MNNLTDLYDEVLKLPEEYMFEEEYYTVSLKIKDMVRVYKLLKENGEYSICDKMSSLLWEEYNVNIEYILSNSTDF